MRAILGISAFDGPAAAALVADGEIVAAAHEERFSRIPGDARFPVLAIESCLREAAVERSEIAFVAFAEKPLRTLERALRTAFHRAPDGLGSFVRTVPRWFGRRLREQVLGAVGRQKIVYVERMDALAASAFFPSPFDQAAILVAGADGEWSTAAWGVGRGDRCEVRADLRHPHSIGRLVDAVTRFVGADDPSGLVFLATQGLPRYADQLRSEVLDVRADGSFAVDPRFLQLGERDASAALASLFARPPRASGESPRRDDLDLAASIQVVVEDAVLAMARHLHAETGLDHLCIAGHAALNPLVNARLVREGPFAEVWVQPATVSGAAALGAALHALHQLLERPRRRVAPDGQRGSCLGPQFSSEEVATALDAEQIVYRRIDDESSLVEGVARFLAEQKVVGWVQGRMPFGPYALASRSVFVDPRSEWLRSFVNEHIDPAPAGRPLIPTVAIEQARDCFELPGGQESPYGLLSAQVIAPAAAEGEERADPFLPAIAQVDGTAQVQTIDAARHPRTHRLLDAFARRTGCPVLASAALLPEGETLACTPADAVRAFRARPIDLLVIEDFVVLRRDQSWAREDGARRGLSGWFSGAQSTG